MVSQKEKIRKLRQELKEQKEETRTTRKRLKRIVICLHAETKKQIVVALLAGFGFLIALVWRDFLKQIADWVIATSHLTGPALLIKLYIAILTTILSVVGILIITKWNKEKEQSSANLTKPA